MAQQFISKVCIGCKKSFQTSNNSDKCYDCTLEDICHGNPPEEGDFNTAGIVSGTLSAQERRYLQQDLESVELGRTTDEEYDDGQDDEDEYYPDEDDEEDNWEFDENEAAKWGDEG